MRDPLPRSFASLQPSTDSWFFRVRENLRQLFTSSPLFPSSASGAPIHLPKWDRSARAGHAQSASLLTHALVICVLALLAVRPPGSRRSPLSPAENNPPSIAVTSGLLDRLRGLHPSEGSGNGSGHDLLPVRQGNLPARSSIQLVKPMIPQNPNPEIPIPPTILDASAPRVLPPVNEIGLPWMTDRNGSSGGDMATPLAMARETRWATRPMTA